MPRPPRMSNAQSGILRSPLPAASFSGGAAFQCANSRKRSCVRETLLRKGFVRLLLLALDQAHVGVMRTTVSIARRGALPLLVLVCLVAASALLYLALAPERFATELQFNGFDTSAIATECARYGMRARAAPVFVIDAVLWSTEDDLLRLRLQEGLAAVNITVVFETTQTFSSGAPKASRWDHVRSTLGVDASRVHHVLLRPYTGTEPRPSFFYEGWARNQAHGVCFGDVRMCSI